MEIPFTEQQFFAVFAQYNAAHWPAAAALWALTLGAFVQLLRGRRADRAIGGILAVHWAWVAVAYHWLHFARINSAASAFAAAFLLEAALLAATAWRGSLRFSLRPTWRHFGGASFVVYGLVYPALAALFVGDYPLVPTFGVPCPTALLTVGFLLLADRTPVSLWIVPLLWSVVGGSAAVLFGVVTDYALLAAAALMLLLGGMRALASPSERRS